jgi:hypothetical protein
VRELLVEEREDAIAGALSECLELRPLEAVSET